jgi:hypothetical protein
MLSGRPSKHTTAKVCSRAFNEPSTDTFRKAFKKFNQAVNLNMACH